MSQKRADIPFIIAISFLTAFLFIRVSVFIAGSADTEFADAAKAAAPPGVDFHIGKNIILFGYHIHHFYIGILLMGIAGWLALTGSRYLSKRTLAMMYGIGLGLFFDEIGLLLTWGDYYSRLSYLLTVLLIGIFLNILFFHDFWESVKQRITDSGSHSLLEHALLSHNTFLKMADFISIKTGKSEKVSLIFTGFLYMVIAGIIFVHPKTVRYWVAVIFIVQGLDYLLYFTKRN
ncbi:MAG: hypothetical protein R6U38_15815 [Desulfatiglandaceae bacterium]